MSKVACAILVDRRALDRGGGDVLKGVASEIAQYHLFGRSGTAPKQNQVALYAFNTRETENEYNASEAAEGQHVVCVQRLEKPGTKLLKLAGAADGEWPDACEGDVAAVTGLVCAGHEMHERCKQLAFEKRLFLVTDDQFTFDGDEGEDPAGEIGFFKTAITSVFQNVGAGFFAFQRETGLERSAAAVKAGKRLRNAADMGAKLGVGGSYASRGGDELRFAASEVCGTLERRKGTWMKLELRVLGLGVPCASRALVAPAKPPTLKKEARETGGAVKGEVSYGVKGKEDDVLKEDLVYGHVYGGEIVVDGAGDAARPGDDAGAACRVLGFAAEDAPSLSAWRALGDAKVLRGQDDRASALLGALARVMRADRRVAVARWRSTARSGEEQLRMLKPPKEAAAAGNEYLLAYRLPFLDDRKDLPRLKAIGGADADADADVDAAAAAYAAAAVLDADAVAALLKTPNVAVQTVQDLLAAKARHAGDVPDGVVDALRARKRARYAKLASPLDPSGADASSSWQAAVARVLDGAAEAAAAADAEPRRRWTDPAPVDGDDAEAAADADAAADAPPAKLVISKQNALADFQSAWDSAASDPGTRDALRRAMRDVIVDLAAWSETCDKYAQKALECLVALRAASDPTDHGQAAADHFDAFLDGPLKTSRDELEDWDALLAESPAARPFAAAAPADTLMTEVAPTPTAAADDDDDDDDFA